MITEMANIEEVARVDSSDNSRCQTNAKVRDKMSRRVRFTSDDNKEDESSGSAQVSIVVHDTEPMTEEEFSSYFIQSDDMKRYNKDMEDTIRKYVDYRLGKGSFDHDSCTIRGLEEVLDHMKCNTKNGNKRRDSRVAIKAQHKQEVLEEVRRQQMAGNNAALDADQVREISLRFSEAGANRAALIASRDTEEVRRINPESSSYVSSDQLVIVNEDCQTLQISAKQVLSVACSSESNCLMEKKNKSGRGGRGRWAALSFSRKTKGAAAVL